MQSSNKETKKANETVKNLQNNNGFVSQDDKETIQDFFANPHEFIKNAVKIAIAEITPATTEPNKDDDFMTLDIAYKEILGQFYSSKQYIYILVKNNAIPSLKIGKKRVFSRTELTEWIAAGRYDYGKAQIEKQAIDYVNSTPLKTTKKTKK